MADLVVGQALIQTGALEGEPPVAWVGIRYRHKVRRIDGNNVLVKVDTIPKGTRSQGWMGIPNVGDIGINVQRYTLDLMGQFQKLQIRTWTTQLERMGKSVPFKWKPNVWYTMKFRAETDGKTATLRGKVWKRGDDEPKAWTIEALDKAPNVQGSPGLFGSATNAEFYMDNFSVTPN